MWPVGRVALVSVAVMALAGVIGEQVARRGARRDHPAPGKLIDVGGGRRIQMDCRGTGEPTVILESGLDFYGSLSWVSVHDSIAGTTRTCAYSRAGIMWSDAPARKTDAEQVARDLHAALAAAGERAPYVVVGHSLGGPYVMTFTRLYPAEVAGMVLIDATHPDQFAPYEQAAGKDLRPRSGILRVGHRLAQVGIVRALDLSAAPQDWPDAIRSVAPAFGPQAIANVANEIDALPASLEQAGRERALGDRPLVVMTAMKGPSPEELKANGITAEQAARVRAVADSLHEDASRWSSRGEHRRIDDAGHYIQVEQPRAVISAVRTVVAANRPVR